MTEQMPVFVFTNIKHHWLLPGCLFLLDTNWPGRQIDVVSYGRRPKEVPDKYGYRKINKSNYPANRWSTGIIEFLERIDDEFFIMLLEDYWIAKPVKNDIVETCETYMKNWSKKDNILRLDLSSDRAAGKRSVHYMPLKTDDGHNFDLIKSKPMADYQMSVQAAIWNKELLLWVLEKDKTAWEVEVEGTEYLHLHPEVLVLGTKERPINYRPTYRVNKNKFDYSYIPAELKNQLKRRGYLDRG